MAGNVTTVTGTGPAGVAGEPINLALTDPPADHVGAVTLTIAGVPSGWSLSEGTDNGDGTWTVQTNNIAALAITSPDSYTGALVLNVTAKLDQRRRQHRQRLYRRQRGSLTPRARRSSPGRATTR